VDRRDKVVAGIAVAGGKNGEYPKKTGFPALLKLRKNSSWSFLK